MILQTLHGFVVTDAIFGVVLIIVCGLCDIIAHIACVFSEHCSPLRRLIIAGKVAAPAEGAGKRANFIFVEAKKYWSTILAINDSIARSETA